VINPPGSAEQFTPALATSWEHSDDGLTWTWHIRQGVTFHDGTALDAAAVVKSIEAEKDHAGASFIWLPLDTIEATDASTVVMHLGYAAPMDLVASSLYGAWIVSPKALDAAAADDTYFESGKDGGTGPYTIESYTPDSEVLLTKYDGYWGGWSDVTHYDKVLTTITPSDVDQQQALDGGAVDIAFSIPLENVASYATNRTTPCSRSRRSSTTSACSTPSASHSTIRSCGRHCHMRSLRRHHRGRHGWLRNTVARSGSAGVFPTTHR